MTHNVVWCIGALVAAILLVMLINEAPLDGTTAKVLRILVIAAALVFALVTLAG